MRSFFLFASVGAIGFLVDAAVLFFLISFVNPYVARIFSFLAAVLVTWILNRSFTFDSQQQVLSEIKRYITSQSLGAGINYFVYATAIFYFETIAKLPLLALGFGSIAGLAVNFILAKKYVFQNTKTQEYNYNMKNITHYFLLIASCFLVVYLFFYQQFNTKFAVMFGDPYDAVIESVLIGHWYKVLDSISQWNKALFFYPIPGSMGYNDSYFIYGLLALPFRILGVNILIAQEYVHIAVKVIGFLSMTWLLNLITEKKSAVNFFGAALFTLMFNSSIQAQHGQLLSVALSPLLFGLILKTTKSINIKGKQFILWGSLFCVFYSAWLLTSFYMAWFFGLFCILVVLLLSIINYSSVVLSIKALLETKLKQAIFLIALFIVCTIPFLLIYMPKLGQTGGHSYQTALGYSLTIFDIINIGSGSLIWGSVFDKLNLIFQNHFRLGEFSVGFTPDVFFVFAIVFLLYFKKKITLTKIQLAVIGAGAIGLFLPVSFHGWSLWWLVYYGVPGASGLRVIARFWIFLSFPIAIAITLFAHKLNDTKKYNILLFFMTFIILSQINVKPPIGLDTRSELLLIEGIPAPPENCEAFFVVDVSGYHSGDKNIDALYSQNIAAMLISDHVNLPTINGFASFLHADWNFSEEPKDTYLARVNRYAKAYNLNNLCEYSNHSWKTNPFNEELK